LEHDFLPRNDAIKNIPQNWVMKIIFQHDDGQFSVKGLHAFQGCVKVKAKKPQIQLLPPI
jgi:hypothetical protein